MSSTDADLSKRLSLLHSSIVHDALRMKGLSNQTLPYQIRPISSGKTISGKVWTLSGELQENISVHDSLLSWTSFLSAVQPDTVVVCQPNNQSIALMGELSAETLVKIGTWGVCKGAACKSGCISSATDSISGE